MTSPSTHSTALGRLRDQLGDRVQTSDETLYRTSFDGMRLAFPHAATIFAEEEQDVGIVLALANEYGVPVTTRGTGTSLTGSAAPMQGGWVLSLENLKTYSIDALNRMARVQAGVVVGELQKAVEARGLFYPPDPSSLRYCTIGGNIACNAGGMRCVKYGVTRDYVVSLRGYLPTGEFVTWGRDLKKFACGYNMRDLWIGSEGTLGVVTGATLRLVPKPEALWSLLLAFPGEREALDAVENAFARGLSPSILEFLDRPSVSGAERAAGEPIFKGMPGRSLLLVQFDGSEADVARAGEEALAWAQELAEAHRVAPTAADAEKLWAIRRQCSGAMFELGDSKLNEDVVVPLDKQVDLLDQVEEIRQRHRVAIAAFGHAGDGNLHVNIMHHRADKDECRRAREAVGELMETVVALGGTISGEHGIGIAKTPFLRLQHTDVEIRTMRALKQALDPKGILNPGKIFEPYEVWDQEKEIYRFPWDHR